MADYVLALGEGRAGGAGFDAARTQFGQLCFACHGADATGNIALGAPDLTDGVYVYGSDLASIRATIADGRQGQMPGFGERLDETQIKLLTVWLSSRAAVP
jgi:cytochrome c oxidase cbb3-type subunit 3